ncbi:hypothetical protein SteCoe_9192 [Stentor coeruleus]|uniref:COPI associated protein n=1 Tax=Stentor coeruleus TaxID=5963 RepID=A0A1R2CIM3_9CILI|nr:hypothetical protein SteCoe_9192 [Stentor coeruleus]
MENKGSPTTKWTYVFKSISFLLGAGLIVIGILDIFGFSLDDPISIVLPIYFILFGLLIIAAEVPLKFVLSRFMFIQNLFGRGLFYIVVGFLCLRSEIWEYIIGGFLLFVGLSYIIIFLACRSRPEITGPPAN